MRVRNGTAKRGSQLRQTHFRNPFKILRELDSHHWLMFFAGWLGWTWDSFDFFTVSLTVTEIAKDFGVANSDVTWVGSLICSLPCFVENQ